MPNLNAEAHFAESPLGVDIGRSTFDRSHNWKGTFNAGKLNCVLVDEILPGDDVAMRVSELVRMTTPLVPTMDDCYLDLTAFFVPYRLVWSHWKEFNGENNSSAWIQPTTYTVPTINAFGTHRSVGDLGHQMGIPPVTSPSMTTTYQYVHALELRSYREIWNTWWRDQNTQAPKLVNTGDMESDTTLFQLLPVDRVHDMFGSCLPGPQKGAAVQIALSGFANVYPTSDSTKNLSVADPRWSSKVSTGGIYWVQSTGSSLGSNYNLGTAAVQNNGNSGSVSSTGFTGPRPVPSNLIVGDGVGNSFGIDVNELRLAVQTQRILEKLSLGGSRYVEFCRAMFGVISPDARQQRPELLGHKRVHIRSNEVVQSAPTETGLTPFGTVGAYSKTVNNDFAFKKSFTEHGTLFVLACIRHNRSYSQGIPKMFSRKTFGDFYLPALAHIGEQPVYKWQIYADGNTVSDTDIFGYQEAFCELRFKPSINTGLMDPAVTGTIGNIWTYGDVYSAAPTLSDSWMQEGDTEIYRTLAVQNQDQFIGDFYFDYKHTRCMPVYSVPGLVDHF